MRREQTLEEISDGKLYDSNDMVKADCQDCKGCSDCCQGMGDTVILDPLDVHRLCAGLKKSPEELLGSVLWDLRSLWNSFCRNVWNWEYQTAISCLISG